jgi:hypothetical protein
MRHPWSVPVLLALAALAGYAAGARPVQAQSQPPLINVGERVAVFYGNGTGRSCQVLAIQGTFLRCEPDPMFSRNQRNGSTWPPPTSSAAQIADGS